MSTNMAGAGNAALAAIPTGTRSSRALKASGNSLFNFFAGLVILFALWWLAIYVAMLTPGSQWAAFGPSRRSRRW